MFPYVYWLTDIYKIQQNDNSVLENLLTFIKLI